MQEAGLEPRSCQPQRLIFTKSSFLETVTIILQISEIPPESQIQDPGFKRTKRLKGSCTITCFCIITLIFGLTPLGLVITVNQLTNI